MIKPHCDIERHIKRAPKMIIEKKIEQLVSKFPQLPTPSYWNKYEKIRYYFNKKEGAQDYTFFIDFTEKNNPQILLNRLNFR